MSQRYQGGFLTASYNGLKVPDAPTIGTASSASTTSVSVAFTAPSNIGGGAITGYTATARKTSDGTLVSASGSSSPIVITGLTLDVSYTVTVVATNAYGTSAPSAASNSVAPFYAIGDAYGGGYYAGDISTNGTGVANFHLVVGPQSSAQVFNQWQTSNTSGTGSTSFINGPSNSANLNSPSYPAAYFCEGLTVGGYSDWYMPARDEFEVIYYNLKPTTTANNTGFGTNAYSVPTRTTNYTAGNPPQTSVAAFKDTGSQYLNTSGNPYYWTSTEYTGESNGQAWRIGADQGNQPTAGMSNNSYTRAVRRVAV